MKTVNLTVKKEICNYMNLLSFNVESRKKLSMLSATENGVDHPVTKAYEREFFIYDAAYRMAMNGVQSIIPIELQVPSTNWNLDFNSGVLTVNIEDSVADKYTSNPEHPTLYSEDAWCLDYDIIDHVIEEKLNKMYDTSSFDYERGLTNE